MIYKKYHFDIYGTDTYKGWEGNKEKDGGVNREGAV